eukprot:SAG31_NODE_4825_length_2924_cov_2.221239_1_plen_365_part_00
MPRGFRDFDLARPKSPPSNQRQASKPVVRVSLDKLSRLSKPTVRPMPTEILNRERPASASRRRVDMGRLHKLAQPSRSASRGGDRPQSAPLQHASMAQPQKRASKPVVAPADTAAESSFMGQKVFVLSDDKDVVAVQTKADLHESVVGRHEDVESAADDREKSLPDKEDFPPAQQSESVDRQRSEQPGPEATTAVETHNAGEVDGSVSAGKSAEESPQDEQEVPTAPSSQPQPAAGDHQEPSETPVAGKEDGSEAEDIGSEAEKKSNAEGSGSHGQAAEQPSAEASVEEAPLAGASAEEAPSAGASVQEVPSAEASVQEAPSAEASAEEAQSVAAPTTAVETHNAGEVDGSVSAGKSAEESQEN